MLPQLSLLAIFGVLWLKNENLFALKVKTDKQFVFFFQGNAEEKNAKFAFFSSALTSSLKVCISFYISLSLLNACSVDCVWTVLKWGVDGIASDIMRDHTLGLAYDK